MPVTQTIEFRAATGQTITAKLFAIGSDTEVASVSATEATNRKGTYWAAYTDVAAGEYQLIALNATPVPVASWLVTLTLTTATFQVYDRVDNNGIRDATLGALLVDYTSTGTVGYVLNAFFAMIEYVTGWRFKSKALEEAPTGATVSVTPVVAQTPVRVVGSNIETFIGDLSDIRVGVFSGTDPVDLSAMGDLEVCVQLKSGADLDVVPMADITIDGDDNNYFSWTPNGESVDAVRTGKWSLRKASNKQVIAYGAWIVVDAALSDAS